MTNSFVIYITGYDNTNLEISKKNQILGWKQNTRQIKQGDFVFVFNITTDKIDSCFEIRSLSNNKNPIWKEEIDSIPSQIIYPYRWDATLKADGLNIDKEEIFELEPFRNNKKNFSLLIRNRFPRSLMDGQYNQFCNHLLDKIKNNPAINETYFLLRTQSDTRWQDKEGLEYHYGDNVPNHLKLLSESNVIFFKTEKSRMFIIGYSRIESIKEVNSDKITSSGRPIKEKIAILKDYQKFNLPIQIDRNIEERITSLPTYNNQHSIIPITKEIYEMLTKEKEPYSIDKLVDTISINKDRILEWESILNEKKQIILYGPPGTGKTFIAIELSKYITSKYGGDYVTIQFHPSYSYEDFIEGLKPKVDDADKVLYDISDGLFKQFCIKAIKNPYSTFILIIDEINRGNLPKVFGELLFSLEYRSSENKIILPYSKEEFYIPKNIFIIGTMNSADRSIALVDYALRRRFYFVELLPDRSILEKFLIKNTPKDVTTDEILKLFDQINNTIIKDDTLGKHYQLGHSYFMIKEIDKDKIKRLWHYAIKPILEEYYLEDISHITNLQNTINEILGIHSQSDKKE